MVRLRCRLGLHDRVFTRWWDFTDEDGRECWAWAERCTRCGKSWSNFQGFRD